MENDAFDLGDPPSSGVRLSRPDEPTPWGEAERPAASVGALPDIALAGRYRLLGRLGRGGVAEVFSAQDERNGQRVAVKLLPAYGSHPAVTRERVEAEMSLCRSVTHPNVCRVLDGGHADDGRPFLVIESLEGETLGQCLRRRRHVSVDAALRLVREAARGLGALHRAGIVHCDVKPDNLFLCDGEVHDVPLKVIDFGFAARTGESPIDPLRVFGTLRYTAPERVVGEPVDGRADLYSLGVVLFRALTGELPFDACTDREIVGHHLTSSVPPASWLREGVSADVDELIDCAMRKHPENRYPTMSALCDDLDRALSGRPVRGVPWVVVPDLFEPSTELGRRVAGVLTAA